MFFGVGMVVGVVTSMDAGRNNFQYHDDNFSVNEE